VTLNLEKLDRFVHLRGTGLDELEWRGSDDEEEGEDGDELGELLDEGEMNEEERERRHAGLTQAEKVIFRP